MGNPQVWGDRVPSPPRAVALATWEQEKFRRAHLLFGPPVLSLCCVLCLSPIHTTARSLAHLLAVFAAEFFEAFRPFWVGLAHTFWQLFWFLFLFVCLFQLLSRDVIGVISHSKKFLKRKFVCLKFEGGTSASRLKIRSSIDLSPPPKNSIFGENLSYCCLPVAFVLRTVCWCVLKTDGLESTIARTVVTCGALIHLSMSRSRRGYKKLRCPVPSYEIFM